MAQITIILKSTEKDALCMLAKQEYRDLRSQAALIIRHELEKAGLLATQAGDSIQLATQVRGVQNGAR
jgi:hypothetical protein